MKLLILAFFVTFALANEEVDWSRIRPIEDLYKDFMSNKPALGERDRRIVNGETAAPHQFPYQVKFDYFLCLKVIYPFFQVAIIMNSLLSSSLCGGSVISQFAVLTAAHCTITNVRNFLIIAGAVNRAQVEATQQRRTVEASGFVQHPNYSQLRLANDIAVLQVTDAFIFNSYVQPVDLASDDENRFVGATVTVSGKPFICYSWINNRE